MRSTPQATRHLDWRMHWIRHAVPRSRVPHIGCDITEWADPDDTRVLRSEIVCATALIIERMLDKDYAQRSIIPIRVLFLNDVVISTRTFSLALFASTFHFTYPGGSSFFGAWKRISFIQ
jgi:hypothetical protein